MTKAARRVMTINEIERVITLLREHCKPQPDGSAAYDRGWDDTAISTAVANGLHTSHVGRMRIQLIGHIKPRKPEPIKVKPKASTENVEATLSAFMTRIEAMRMMIRHQAAAIAKLEFEMTNLYVRLNESRPEMARPTHAANGQLI